MTVYGGPEIVTSGLVLYLDGANKKSYPGTGTSWTDLSGNGNDGTLTNGPSYNSVRNGTIILDGIDDYIISSAANGTGMMDPSLYNNLLTVSIWFRPTSTRASQYVITTGHYTGGVSGFVLVFNDGGINGTDYVGFGSSTKRWDFTTSNFISTNEWINVCFLINDINMYVYKNGNLITTRSSTANTASSNNQGLVFGKPNGLNNFYFTGNIGITQIYNRALSASEILNNYNALKGRYASYLTDPDAITYVAAVEAADGQELERSVALAYQDFIVGCKADNIWSAIKASCILMGARTLAGALVPLAGTAPTNNNFVTADYNRKTGLAGDGSSKYLNSNRGNSTDPQDDVHISCYASSAGAGNNVYVGVVYDSNTSIQPPDWIFNRGRSAGIGGSTPTGFIGTSRSNANNFDRRINGSTGTISGISIAPVTSDKFFIFARNAGYPQFYSSARLSFYSIGTSLDLSKLDARVSALYTAIGAATP